MRSWPSLPFAFGWTVQAVDTLSAATETTLFDAYEISVEKSHDVYDSFIVALARAYDADYLITTDSGFDDRCEGEDANYINPISVEQREKSTPIDEYH